MAGEGDLPRHLAEAGRRNGVDLLVIGIEGLVDAQVRPEHVLGLGEVGRLKRLLDSHGVERVAFAGRFYRRTFPAFPGMRARSSCCRRSC